jgi:YD repeat-containing protein
MTSRPSVTTHAYDAHGSLASTTDARSVAVTRAYDAADRVILVDYPDPALDITYTYDDPGVTFSQGRLTAITRDGLSVDYEYDRFGRTVQDGELTYAYDENGNRTEIGYPGGEVARYTHDFADREATLEFEPAGGSAESVVTFQSGPWGNRPDTNCCDQDEILASIASADNQVFKLDIGVPLEGIIGSFVISGNACYQDGWCISHPFGPFDPPIVPNVTDPCAIYCIRVHEWFHYQDRRPRCSLRPRPRPRGRGHRDLPLPGIEVSSLAGQRGEPATSRAPHNLSATRWPPRELPTSLNATRWPPRELPTSLNATR